MTDVVTDDSASEVLTLAAASEYDAESLWDESTHTVIAEGSAAAQASKAIEAATEREPTADDTASIASGHSARRSHGNLSRAPILDAGPAPPPTYQAATAWRASPAPLNGHVQRAPNHEQVGGEQQGSQVATNEHRDLESQTQNPAYTNVRLELEQLEHSKETDSSAELAARAFREYVEKLPAKLDNDYTRAARKSTTKLQGRPTPVAQKVPIEVWSNVAVSPFWEAASPVITRGDRGLHLQLPRLIADDGPTSRNRKMQERLRAEFREQAPRVDLRVGIYITIEVENFEISTENFAVNIGSVAGYDHWGLSVSGTTNISAKGPFSGSASLNSKETIVNSRSPLSGSFILRDRVELRSEAGDLQAKVIHIPRVDGILGSDEPLTYSTLEALEHIKPSILRTNATGGGTGIDYRRSAGWDEGGVFSGWPINNSTIWPWNSVSYALQRVGRAGRDLFLLDASHASDSDTWLGYPRRSLGEVNGVVQNGSIHVAEGP